ncbi:hypothetical protein WJ970_29985 [Achromobacter xylosoxidans]
MLLAARGRRERARIAGCAEHVIATGSKSTIRAGMAVQVSASAPRIPARKLASGSFKLSSRFMSHPAWVI